MSLDKSWIERGKQEYDNCMSSMAEARVGASAFAYGAECFKTKLREHFVNLGEDFGTNYADITINYVLETIDTLKA